MSSKFNPLSWIGNAVGTILGGGEKAPAPTVIQAPPPPAPEVKEPPVMPTPDDEAIRKSQASSLARQRSRRGRQSTILTSEGDTFG